MVKTVPPDGVDAVQFPLDEAQIVFFFRFVALAFHLRLFLKGTATFSVRHTAQLRNPLGRLSGRIRRQLCVFVMKPVAQRRIDKNTLGAVFSRSLFRLDACGARSSAVTWHPRLWRRSLGGRLGNMTPEQESKKVIEQLEITQKGIILLHDPRARRTAAMMPAFLRYLHDQGYRIVHLVPAAAPLQKHADGAPH